MKTNYTFKSILLAATAALCFSTPTLRAHAADHQGKNAPGVPAEYPLKKCVVSDDPLGEHGKAIKETAPDGTVVYLCCKDCIKDFKKDPAKYAKMVKEAKK